MGKIIETLILVVGAVGISAVLWVGANLLFGLVRNQWQRFTTILGALAGYVIFFLLEGNRLLTNLGAGTIVWLPFVGAGLGAALGWFLADNPDPERRRLVATGGLLAVGVIVGALIDDDLWPRFDFVKLIGFTVVLAGVGYALPMLRRTFTPAMWGGAAAAIMVLGLIVGGGINGSIQGAVFFVVIALILLVIGGKTELDGALAGGALGFLLGGFGGADLGDGTVVESILAAAVPAGLIGYRIGTTTSPDLRKRAAIDNGSRSWIFLTPALSFIIVTLLIPTIRTLYLSFLDARSEAWAGIDNYTESFTNRTSFDIDDWTNIFTSRLVWVGVIILVIAIAVGEVQKTRTGRRYELGGPAFGPLMIASTLLVFGVLSVLRGTIMNNLWWVFTVTLFSTALGLAIAVLADGNRFESIAKSIIFMPMAVSLVGASVIWRFMYIARDPSKEQTGVINKVWTELGFLSTGSGLPTLIGAILLGLLALAAFAWCARLLVRGEYLNAPLPAIAAFGIGYVFLRYIGIFGDGVGGFRVLDDGTVEANPVLFVQEQPFNSVWLMVILIWIQTGFAMVILSAAIKAVPDELLEAARVDGATESQVFWRVTLPQIATTIGVVVTTIIVLVMKVFDIVKVVTNGNFGTQVLANDMFQQAFQFQNRGRGAALAIILFISVLPVMVTNIRRMQREEA
ncbi:MAG: sugar ABC transporter permease [Actinomycetota bacterium]